MKGSCWHHSSRTYMILMIILLLVFIIIVVTVSKTHSADQERLMVLTFDDGPKPYVLYGLDMTSHRPTGRPGLVKVLTDARIPAHFFVIGFKAKENKDIVRDLAARGFLFENHTYGHEFLSDLQKKKGLSGIKANLESIDKLFTELTGRRPKYFRPRSWVITAEEEQFIRREFGYTVLKLGHPDLNMLDYDFHEKKRPAAELIDYVKKRLTTFERSGQSCRVLAFHELPITTEALVELIPYFKSRGYRFVTLDECLIPTKKEVAG